MKTQMKDKLMTTPNIEPKPDSAATSGRVQRLVRLFRYLFVERLAVQPRHEPPWLYDWHTRRFYEWQKLPEGYRWF